MGVNMGKTLQKNQGIIVKGGGLALGSTFQPGNGFKDSRLPARRAYSSEKVQESRIQVNGLEVKSLESWNPI
jgi:hypothetical protein